MKEMHIIKSLFMFKRGRNVKFAWFLEYQAKILYKIRTAQI